MKYFKIAYKINIMKSTKYIIISVVVSLFLTTCTKRDNPTDEKNAILKFDSYRLRRLHAVSWGECDNCHYGIIVSLKNTGAGNAKGVKATFSSTSSYVSDFDPTYAITYHDIAAGKVKWVWTDLADPYAGTNSESEPPPTRRAYTIRIAFSSYSMPIDTQIPVNINIVDANGNSWSDSFSVPIQEFINLTN